MDSTHAKSIFIIGGGIGGAAALHFLKKKYAARNDVSIKLIEAADKIGGTVQTLREDDFTFETGPNGFLNSKQKTLDLISDLGLAENIITADESAKIRYICKDDALVELPASPAKFFTFPLLTIGQKLCVLLDFILPEGRDHLESVYDFGARRFGKQFASLFLDPMVTGIFGGDAKKLVLKQAFPNIYQMEHKFGSLFKAQIYLKSKNKKASAPKGRICSLTGGMNALFQKIQSKYQADIILNQKVQSIEKFDGKYRIETLKNEYTADAVIAAAPAYCLSPVFSRLNEQISVQLDKIEYAPITVVGLGYDKYDMPKIPKGYGYLIPSSEQKEVLGVLFEHQIFPQRYPSYHSLLRVMLGGVRHPEAAHFSDEEALSFAKTEVKYTLGINKEPHKIFIRKWKKAIPQYNLAYCEARKIIAEQMHHLPNLFFAANFWDGISFTDCVDNAARVSDEVDLTESAQPLAVKSA